ncbi:histidinol phosphate phosphatase H [Microstroma glucosiphilum]|uniref:histidinol-phosphatase n=1 Tax=Pseudomicrostroma glucosiphilum TaxID=1684307 RepID=A0A316U2J8_9BASI|nr:histidinol phosphate phosphatase H [Pseudomicrostroma glucosiphilum]PWN19477.1 histidinol phosphate phosphatase H [Pseudomicrostroma glucosiphilum]
MHSHHSHSALFCSHAHPDSHPEGMLSRAASLGFKVYGLSEHVPRELEAELYPEEVGEGSTPKSLFQKWQGYLTEARRLQSRYQREPRNMKVLVGAETEWISRQTGRFLSSRVLGGEASSSQTGASLGRGMIDYLVGSVHHAGGIAYPTQSEQAPLAPVGIPIDFDKATFDRAVDHFKFPEDTAGDDTPARLRLCLSYFEAQYQMIDQLRPEVIGHFDLCRLFMPGFVLLPSGESAGKVEAENPSGVAPLREELAKVVDRNVRLAVSYGALFEINSASLRKSWDTPYPARDVLDRILALGGRLCLSDDAHGPTHVGISYSASRSYLLSAGVTSIYHLDLPSEAEQTSWSSQGEQSEEDRKKRGSATRPGDGAPLTFARGCIAREVTGWERDPFWKGLEERQARLNARKT